MCYFTLLRSDFLRSNQNFFCNIGCPSDRISVACYRGVRHWGDGATMVKAETPMQPLSSQNK